MKKSSKKGAAMVEAAMIFPLVIAGVMAVLYIVINMYSSLSLQTSLHMALRRESGELSQTVYRQEAGKDFPLQKDWVGIRPVLRMEQEREYEINILFHDRVARQEAGRTYVVDEAELIRILPFHEGES